MKLNTFTQRSKIIAPLCITAIVVIFYSLFVTNSLRAFKQRGIDILPPEAGDGVEYEHIAFNIYQGKGFVFDWNDPEWRAPFLKFGDNPIFRRITERSGELYPTAYRPPLYPYLLSFVYDLVGRNFFFARLLNFWLFFGAFLLTAYTAFKCFGNVAALIVLALAEFDPSLRLWSYYFMSEPLATFLTAALLCACMYYRKRPVVCLAMLVGLILALLILTRTIALFWFPTILMILIVRSVSRAQLVRNLLAFGIALGIPLSLWMARNALVVDSSAMMGTQAGVNFVVDYSDAIIEQKGLWISASTNELMNRINENSDFEKLAGKEREVAANEWGKQTGIAWIKGNLLKIPTLASLKLRSLWWNDIQPYHLYIACFAFVGIFLFRSYTSMLVPIALLAGNSFAVALTHNVPAGRFIVPMLPCLYLVAAGTLSQITHVVVKKVRVRIAA